MNHGTRPLAMILLGLFALSCSGEDRKPKLEGSPSGVAPTPVVENHPEGFLAKNLESPYWKAYRAVIFKTECDSLGKVKDAEVLYDFASAADTDSLREIVFNQKFDKEIWVGQIRRGSHREPTADPDLLFLVPFATPCDTTVAETIPSREELEHAGLGPWLAVWDDVLPDWPVESWKKTYRSSMHLIPDLEVDDAPWEKLDILSAAPSGPWRLHPFSGVEVAPDGRAGFDVDSGFVLYRVDQTGLRSLVTGTTGSYCLAEWIDDERFVVAGTSETGLSYADPGKGSLSYIAYRCPVLYVGTIPGDGFWLSGPPIPVWRQAEVARKLADIKKNRYPKLWKALHAG